MLATKKPVHHHSNSLLELVQFCRRLSTPALVGLLGVLATVVRPQFWSGFIFNHGTAPCQYIFGADVGAAIPKFERLQNEGFGWRFWLKKTLHGQTLYSKLAAGRARAGPKNTPDTCPPYPIASAPRQQM
jgi:hypothetical protein